MVDLWTRMSSLTQSNQDKWDVELDWIISSKLFVGVRVNIGMAGSYGTLTGEDRDLARNPSSANTKRLEYVLRRLASNKLMVQLGLGGDGPNNTITEWKALNSTVQWDDVKRPPLGDDDGTGLGKVVKQSAYIKNEAIKKMRDVYLSYGLNPYDYCILELGNEPAIGGAGAPPSGSTFYTDFTPLSYTTNLGRWDNASDVTGSPAATKGATYIEFLSREIKQLNALDDGFKGWLCVAPTFAGARLAVIGSPASLDCELGSFDRANSAGEKWVDLVQQKNRLILGLNCYYSAFDALSTGVHPELYVWPSLGPVEYADIAVNGFDYRGLKSGDEACIVAKIAMIRGTFRNLTSSNLVQNRLAKFPIVISEAGVANWRMGMTDTPSSGSPPTPVGSMDANYYVNDQIVGEAQLAYLDALRGLDVEHVIHFTTSDAVSGYSGTNWKERYGLFLFDIDKDVDYSTSPFLQAVKTYSAMLPWLRRAELAQTTSDTSITNANKGAFWGLGFQKGDSEEVP
ncbi:MAG: hypothetical protein U0S12_03615 [Fimbriimonadales bacterium]